MIWPEIKPNTSFNLLKETLNGSLFFAHLTILNRKDAIKMGLKKKMIKLKLGIQS